MDKKRFWKRTYRFLILWGVITIGFLIELIIESYPELPTKLNKLWLILLIGPPLWLLENVLGELFIGRPAHNALHRLGEKKIRTINKILIGIIVIPIVVMVLIALVLPLFK